MDFFKFPYGFCTVVFLLYLEELLLPFSPDILVRMCARKISVQLGKILQNGWSSSELRTDGGDEQMVSDNWQ